MSVGHKEVEQLNNLIYAGLAGGIPDAGGMILRHTTSEVLDQYRMGDPFHFWSSVKPAIEDAVMGVNDGSG